MLRGYNQSLVNEKYKFNEKEQDIETGFLYYGARYYDGALGIWHQTDPLSFLHPNMSPYNYCMNNPLRFRDLWGLDTSDIYDPNASTKRGDFVLEPDCRLSFSIGDLTVVGSRSSTGGNWGGGSGSPSENDGMGMAGYGIGGASTAVGIAANAKCNELYWQGKNGKWYLYTAKSKPGGYARSYKIVNSSLKTIKNTSRLFGSASVAFTGVKIVDNYLTTGDIKYSDLFDLGFGIASFIPGVGWAIGGVYFVTDVTVNLTTGQSLGEHFENLIEGKE